MIQKAAGVPYTFVNGEVVIENGAPTGACPNCWRAGVVVDLSDGSESRWWTEDRVLSFDFIL
jgi:hypothetical protein